MSSEQFAAAFYEALGFYAPSVELDERHAAAAATPAREPAPWDAEVPLDRLAAAPFRKLVVSGNWDIAPLLAREIAGSAFGVICDVLEKKLPAERAIFRGAAHNPQLLGNNSTTASDTSWPLTVAARRVRFMVSPGRGSVPVGHAWQQIVVKQTVRRPVIGPGAPEAGRAAS
jgi:hypothetical protein